MQIEYLTDHLNLASLLAAWHYREWASLLPDWSLEEALRELQSHTGRRQIPTTLVAVEQGRPFGGQRSAARQQDARNAEQQAAGDVGGESFPRLAGEWAARRGRRAHGSSSEERAGGIDDIVADGAVPVQHATRGFAIRFLAPFRFRG